VSFIKELQKRVERIEAQEKEQALTLIEILSSAAFFGGLKQANCPYAHDGQCSYYVVGSKVKNKLPLVAACRIKGCKQSEAHNHIEISSVTCSLCQNGHHNTSSR
jgi:hypothetical protein